MKVTSEFIRISNKFQIQQFQILLHNSIELVATAL